ncbi:MAG: hypothetical protein KatS3mg131_3758 [Candidatus Tectimicrobiota bacterium]|nr:MAG: hypothetical protein KatS3mg131_3758 [Candidatus Tectomicrobia bacterium]
MALVIEAVLRLRQDSPDVSLFPLVADVEAVPELAALLAAQAPPAGRRLLACFGLLPNLDYGTFLPALRRLLRPGDWLLLSANLSPQPYPDACPAILPQYDNPLAHAWFLGLLDSLGVPPRHAELRVTAQPLRVDGHIWQIRAVAVFCRPTTLTLYGESFAFAAGERVQLFFSTRFTPEAVPEVLAAAGLPVVAAWVFAGQEEGLYLCTPG